MNTQEKFTELIKSNYTKENALLLGTAIFNGTPLPNAHVTLPFKTLNRHGLIAGATGTGKTKTLQGITEGLSNAGVPVLLMDVKGDLSGIAKAGQLSDAIKSRVELIRFDYQPQDFPTELYSLSGENGTQLRATVSEFGPVLLSKILDLNETQSGILAVVFKYCDDKLLPLVDLSDLKAVLNFIGENRKKELEQQYGKVSEVSISTIFRKVVELEQQGANTFFGEPSFDVNDLLELKNGKGLVNIIRLTDIQDKPKMFSTFMLTLLAEIYNSFPEIGDVAKPKLVLFIDEAHLIFNEASKELVNQIESIVRLIRSKGVSVIFCTQSPDDIPENVLAQLGFKIQHALRAFTAKDRKAIKQIAENYPESEFYKTEELLTSLGIGEAAVTVLSNKGYPTPLAATLLAPPRSRMGILNQVEIDELLNSSTLHKKYAQSLDKESAFELLQNKMQAEGKTINDETEVVTQKKNTSKEKSTIETILNSPVTKQIGRTVASTLVRGLLGALGLTSRRR